MAQNRSDLGRLVIFVILGLFFGGILGETIGYLFGFFGEKAGMGFDNSIRSVFTGWFFDFGVGKNAPITLDLNMIKLTFGFGFRMNVMSIAGVFLALYMMKWSGER